MAVASKRMTACACIKNDHNESNLLLLSEAHTRQISCTRICRSNFAQFKTMISKIVLSLPDSRNKERSLLQLSTWDEEIGFQQ